MEIAVRQPFGSLPMAGRTASPVVRDLLDVIGEARGRLHRAVRAPHADGEPVGDVVVEAPADQDRPLVLVEQGERDDRGQLEPAGAVQPKLAHGGRAGQRAGELDFLRGCDAARWQTRRAAPRAPSGIAASSPLSWVVPAWCPSLRQPVLPREREEDGNAELRLNVVGELVLAVPGLLSAPEWELPRPRCSRACRRRCSREPRGRRRTSD